ncbi:hypothetical protein KJ039_01575 [bacterium]|nr:hypothetical protein [bacterium]
MDLGVGMGYKKSFFPPEQAAKSRFGNKLTSSSGCDIINFSFVLEKQALFINVVSLFPAKGEMRENPEQ